MTPGQSRLCSALLCSALLCVGLRGAAFAADATAILPLSPSRRALFALFALSLFALPESRLV